MNRIVLSLSAACALLLGGCGGASSTPSSGLDSGTTVLTGVFVDSPVEGLSYVTQTQSGTTSASGEFKYLLGEQVTFSIGAINFPVVAASAQVTPVDIATSSGNPAAMATNIARLLQSLDLDGNPANGITIPATAAASAGSVDFDVSTDDFANNAAVINLVSNSGSVLMELVSAAAANEHLNETLGTQLSAVNEIVLDLRDSEWMVVHPRSCDGMSNQSTLRYTQTRFSGQSSKAAIQIDGSCFRDVSTWDVAINDLSGSGFVFLCGGDAQCTYNEVNRSLILAADDPRNDCVDSNGQSQSANRSISYVPGSNVFSYGHCNASEYTAEHIRQ